MAAVRQRHFRGIYDNPEQLGTQHSDSQRSRATSDRIIEPDCYHRRRLPWWQLQSSGYRRRWRLHFHVQGGGAARHGRAAPMGTVWFTHLSVG
jgi:hypothetical protein